MSKLLFFMESEDLTLLQVNIITRHGSRCPLKNYEMDESREKEVDDFWNEQILQTDFVNQINTLFPLEDVKLCPRTDPYGRLTKIGFNQMYSLGKKIVYILYFIA